MKSFLPKFLVICASLALTGCLGLDSQPDPTDLSHTFVDTENSFEIKFPETFLKAPSADTPTGAFVALVDLESPTDFTINVTVTGEQLSEPVSSLRYALANIAKNAKTLPGYSEREVRDFELNSERTKLLFFTVKRGDHHTNFVQLFATDHDRGFVITAASPAETTADKKQLLTDIVSSFRTLAPTN